MHFFIIPIHLCVKTLTLRFLANLLENIVWWNKCNFWICFSYNIFFTFLMYFFVFLTSYILPKICKIVILYAIFKDRATIWDQNGLKMCLNSYSFINKEPFSNKIYFFFYQFPYFWNVFADISKCGKLQAWVTGTDVTQKRNIDLTGFLVQMLSRCVITKLCLRIFNFYFQTWITL